MPHVIEEIDHECSAWRSFLLHNKGLHLAIIVLLGIDALICLTCGVLEQHYYSGKSNDCQAFVDACGSHRRLSDPLRLRSGADLSPVLSLFTSRFLSDRQQTSERQLGGSIDCAGQPHFGNHDLHDAEVILAYVSIGILSLFLIEQVLLIWELKCEYFAQPLFVLDFLVITSSLIIEIVVTNLTIIGLLVLARMWRFARIGHGVFEGTHTYEESFLPDDEPDKVSNMKECWEMIDDRRWEEICTRLSNDQLKASLTNEEKELAEMLRKNPVVALRALAFAQAYKKKMDTRLLRKKVQEESSMVRILSCE